MATQDEPAVCTCTELSSEDIPGSMISRADLEKCKKSELKFWLNCRGLRYKSTETRAELLSRKWSEQVIKAVVKHLDLPQQVLSTLLHLVQTENCEDEAEKIDMQMAPLIAALKTESQLQDTLVLLPKDLLSLIQELGGYDARLRVLIFHLGDQLLVQRSVLKNHENNLVERLKQLKNCEPSEDAEVQRKKKVTRQRKKAFMIALGAIGGGALIGVTGGLAAPLVAAGAGAVIGASSAAVLGTTAGVAVIASLFGAAGAGLTGYRLSRRIGEVEQFEFEPLGNGEQLHLVVAISGWLKDDEQGYRLSRRIGEVEQFEFEPLGNGEQLHLVVAISGWLKDDEQDIKTAFQDPWRHLNISLEQYSLIWESRYLAEMGNAMYSFFTSNSISFVTQEALKYTVLNGLITAVTWPLLLLQLGYAIDNPWNVCSRRAAETGKLLADVLISRQQGRRPVTLVGFSLGARVIFFCLEALAKKGALGIVEDAILLGAPVSGDEKKWRFVGQVVAGKLINGYCSKDWFLRYVYRAASAQLSIAGLQAIKWKNRRMINADLSELIDGHLEYSNPDKIKTVLEILGIDTKCCEAGATEAEIDSENICTVNQTMPSHDEAKKVVMEILEERIKVALEVCTMTHQSSETEQQDLHGHVIVTSSDHSQL